MILPEQSRLLRDNIIEMLIREHEMVQLLQQKNCLKFPKALSLKLLRTFISPKFDNVAAARALSIFIFKNKETILQKYELLKVLEGAATYQQAAEILKPEVELAKSETAASNSNLEAPECVPEELPEEITAQSSAIIGNIEPDSDLDDWATSTSDMEETSRESLAITSENLRYTKPKKKTFLRRIMDENLGTIEESGMHTRRRLFSGKKNTVDKSSVEGDNNCLQQQVENPKKRSMIQLYECYSKEPDEHTLHLRQIKSSFLTKKFNVEAEILEIQKSIEMEKLRQEQFTTQIRLVELGMKKREYCSMQMIEESPVD